MDNPCRPVGGTGKAISGAPHHHGHAHHHVARGIGHARHHATAGAHHPVPVHPAAHAAHPATACGLTPSAQASLKAPLGVPPAAGTGQPALAASRASSDLSAALQAASSGTTKGVPAALLPAARGRAA